MRFLALISSLLIAAALTACGGTASDHAATGSAAVATAPETRTPKLSMSNQERAKLPPLTTTKQSGPSPRRVEVIDLRKGTGAAITRRDAMVVKFISVPYTFARTGRQSGGSQVVRFGMDEVIKGWVIGLPGMRVGGRRELVVPPKLGHPPEALVYAIDLLAIEPNGGAD